MKEPLKYLNLSIFRELSKAFKISSNRKKKLPEHMEVEYKDPN